MSSQESSRDVHVLDVDAKNLERGMTVIKKNYARSVERKSKSQAQVDQILARFKPSTSYSDFAQVDIVVEAVFENMELKKKIFKTLDEVCKKGCILASNTSRLNIDDIASVTTRPEDVVGCHFFSPANVMKLLENVRGPRTSDVTIATAMAFGQKLKKVTCLVGNCNGFIANRVMGVSGFGALVNGGILPQQIDAAAEAYGMKMGPARMNDLVGLDLFGREREKAKIAKPDTIVHDALYKLGRFGQKNGKGFYKYDEKRKHSVDPEAEEIVRNCWKTAGVQPRSLTEEQIVDALYLPVVNEGFKCLEEGMASRPSDIDVCCVFGYNWPRYRGGPMQWASAVGLATVQERLEAMGEKPAELLKECVKNNWRLNSKGFTKRISDTWAKRWQSAASSKL
eukprot:TRINITY_DN22617_c0_g1_i1.p1 TRINITY_DN22617_c0_g1~~TRINITY_DN22617_c0_g1_i1.p1  ORF type:complete len:396 (-),score=94.19 TRINITY_DN22617_c0_g1_i1:188-1375(-)